LHWPVFCLHTRAELHEVYEGLFGKIGDLIKGKHLLIVPSGRLTQLPFQVLVTEKPDTNIAGIDALRHEAWLAKSNAITVLPAVSSLTQDYQQAHRLRRDQRVTSRKLRGGMVDVAELRSQVPLPETADELCSVARNLGVPESDIRLGSRASENEVKGLSDSGELAAYRILHFATHGTLAGELRAGAEPGLILSPPDTATPHDDGYLSASEIAGLKLDADWVILSACNTAAGGETGAEALSGLARAFFYAGSRALLVSHWSVDSYGLRALLRV
jgi:CHAT domain-containing protein